MYVSIIFISVGWPIDFRFATWFQKWKKNNKFSILCRTKSSKKLKNPRNCFSWKNPRESFSSVLDYSSQQKDRHYFNLFGGFSRDFGTSSLYGGFETRDYSTHSGYFTSGSAVARSSTSSQWQVRDSGLQHTQRILHFRFSSVQDPVWSVYGGLETRDYSTHSGYFTSGSAVFKIRYEQSTAGLRLEITAYTADISLPVQQCSRSSTSSLWQVWDSGLHYTQRVLHFRFSSVQDLVQAVYGGFETREYSTHSGYFTSGSAAFKVESL